MAYRHGAQSDWGRTLRRRCWGTLDRTRLRRGRCKIVTIRRGIGRDQPGTAGRRCAMGMLDRFEKKVESAVNNVLAKAFRSEVKPVEIASATRRAMDHRAAAVTRGRTVDRKSTRLNSSHVAISYAVFCLK